MRLQGFGLILLVRSSTYFSVLYIDFAIFSIIGILAVTGLPVADYR